MFYPVGNWAKEYYYRKRNDGKSHYVALRALANNWVRIVYAMWLTNEPYDSAIFLKARTIHYHWSA